MALSSPKHGRTLLTKKPPSPDPDREGTKVTMQTKVAVRDKTPHRFQVIPLREIMKAPSQTEQPAGPLPSKSSHQLSSRSGRTFSVHADDPEIEQKTRSLGRASGRRVLQKKDTNRGVPELKHKKTASLEVDSKGEPAIAAQDTTPSTPPVPSLGFSQSLGQYSFRLKPWKSYIHLHASLNRSSCDDSTFILVEAPTTNQLKGEATADNPSIGLGILPPTPSPSNCLDKQDSPAVDPSPSFSTTLNDSDPKMDTLSETPDQDSKKRHAIYSHSAILPLGRVGFHSDTGSRPSLFSYDGLSPVSETCGTPLPRMAVPSHRALAENRDSAPAPANSTLSSTLPLKLVRNSLIKPGLCNDEVLYPESVLEIMLEIDDAIQSWNT